MPAFHPIVFGYLASRRVAPAEAEPVAAEVDAGSLASPTRLLGVGPLAERDAFGTVRRLRRVDASNFRQRCA
jgi:hypothetical protein